jgi:hypothetical protein
MGSKERMLAASVNPNVVLNRVFRVNGGLEWHCQATPTCINLHAMKRLTVWCLLAFLGFGFSRAAAEEQWEIGVERARLAPAPFWPDRESRLPVEYTRQKGPQCLSTAAAMALRYYGTAMEPGRIYALCKWDPPNKKGYDFQDGSTFSQLMNVLAPMDYHWCFKAFRGDHNGFHEGMVKINEQIAHGRPVIVETYFGYGEAHAVLVYGYDDLSQLVFILDSALPPPGRRVLTCDEFESIWSLRALADDTWRNALFTLPKGEVAEPPAPAEDAKPLPCPPPAPSPPAFVTPLEPTPTPAPVQRPSPTPVASVPTPSPQGAPEKFADNRTDGGFRHHKFPLPLPPLPLPPLPGISFPTQPPSGRVVLKPFVP